MSVASPSKAPPRSFSFSIRFRRRHKKICCLFLVLFGIGGLQISGPVIMAVTGDNSQLYLKAMIDFPLAMLTGEEYTVGYIVKKGKLKSAPAERFIEMLGEYGENLKTKQQREAKSRPRFRFFYL